MDYWSRVTVTIVVTLGVLAAAWSVRQILTLVLISAVLAVGLEPAVQRLERWRVKRGWAVLIIFVSTTLWQPAPTMASWLVTGPRIR